MITEIKKIHIGELLLRAVTEIGMDEEHLCTFFGCSASEISEMYHCKSIDTALLLKWSKLLEYDFFRLYSQHLILYAPQVNRITEKNTHAGLPNFRKNIYSYEVIAFLLELIRTREKTIKQIMEEYGVPKATIYRWITKHESLTTE